jgi:tetratricopeptide (TPR) repeat protein
MHHSSLLLTAALVGTTVALVQPAASAKSAAEIEAIAKAVTVEIKFPKKDGNGSGIIIQKQGNLYTLVTNRHVICGTGSCNIIPSDEVFTLDLPDGQKYKVSKDAIKLLGSSNNVVDLAIIQFRSNRNYAVAKMSTSGSPKVNDAVYTAGFPSKQPGFSFNGGKAIAVVNKRLTGDGGGYTMIYDAFTLPGMSGGGVFDSSGQLVAIHGLGDRYKENTETNDRFTIVGSKIGYNRGIPVRWLIESMIYLGTGQSIQSRRDAGQEVVDSADEYFITGFNKFVDPGQDVKAGKREAIQALTKAIKLKPSYSIAYLLRAYIYGQVGDYQLAFAEYNQLISLSPLFSNPYIGRSILKYKLSDHQGALADLDYAIRINPNDLESYIVRGNVKYASKDYQGALTDYNKVIALKPDYTLAYFNRGDVKYNLKDYQGALADYNQTIILNQKLAAAYSSRGLLKANKLNDRAGAIRDFRQAARLFREQGQTEYLQFAIKNLQLLNATE